MSPQKRKKEKRKETPIFVFVNTTCGSSSCSSVPRLSEVLFSDVFDLRVRCDCVSEETLTQTEQGIFTIAVRLRTMESHGLLEENSLCFF